MLLAVLVPATDTVNADLERIIEPQMEALGIDDYRPSGVTGARDPDYDPTRDPANHEPCSRRHCTLRDPDGNTCHGRADAVSQGRSTGTVLKLTYVWARHPGIWSRWPGFRIPAGGSSRTAPCARG